MLAVGAVWGPDVIFSLTISFLSPSRWKMT